MLCMGLGRMVLRISLLIVLFSGIWLLSGCGDSRESQAHRFLLPWLVEEAEDLDGEGAYRLQEVEVRGLRSPHRLKGDRVEVFSQVQGLHSGRMSGRVAEPRLAQNKGLWVPKDGRSSLAVALYAHMDQLVRLDERLSSSRHLRSPRQAAVEIRIQGGRSNQAIYQPRADGIYFSPYSMDGLPLAVNGGVIAHEHFHAHFNELVLKPLLRRHESQSLPQLNKTGSLALQGPADYNWALLRAWNEGLADFWAFVYGQGRPFLQQSLGETNTCRSFALPLIPESLRSQPLISSCNLYLLGSQFTGLLKALAERNEIQWPSANGWEELTHYEAVAALILDRLPLVHERLQASFVEEVWDPAELLYILFEGLEFSRESCFLIKGALNWESLRLRSLGESCS